MEFNSGICFPDHIEKLLESLHQQSQSQEQELEALLESSSTGSDSENPWLAYMKDPQAATMTMETLMHDKLLAISRNKCQFIYSLARALNVKSVVEVGTSCGVSTIYLAVAVGENVRDGKNVNSTEGKGIVIATEKDAQKCKAARLHWKSAGYDEVEKWIELIEGDLTQTLADQQSMDDILDSQPIDLVILDAWPHIAAQALEILRPRLRTGAVVLTDGSEAFGPMHVELFKVLRNPNGSFKTVTLPFEHGLDMSVYLPHA